MQFFTSWPDPYYTAKQLPTGLRSSLLCPSVLTHYRNSTSIYWSILQPRSALQIHLSQYLFTRFTSRNFWGFLRQTGQYSIRVIACIYFKKWGKIGKNYISYIHKNIFRKQSSTQVNDETEPNVELQKFTEGKEVSTSPKNRNLKHFGCPSVLRFATITQELAK